MITVNLLPLEAWRARARGRAVLAALGLVGLMAAAALIAVKVQVLDRRLENLAAESRARQGELAALEAQVAEAAEVTSGTVKDWERLMAILELEERRRDQTRLLVEVDRLLPQERAWLISLSHEKGLLTLEGLAMDAETVGRFLGLLESSIHLERPTVKLVNLSPRPSAHNPRLAKFTIEARTIFQPPTLADQGLPDHGWPERSEFLRLVAAAAPQLAESPEIKAFDRSL